MPATPLRRAAPGGGPHPPPPPPPGLPGRKHNGNGPAIAERAIMVAAGLRDCLAAGGYDCRPGAGDGPLELACGRVVAIDIDVGGQAAAAAIETLARTRFAEDERADGRLLVRVGPGGRRTILLRTDAPFAALSATLVAPDGTLATISILGDGGVVLAYGGAGEFATPGSDPGGGEWIAGSPITVDADELAQIGADDARALLADAAELLTVEHGYRPRSARPSGEPPPHPGAQAAAPIPANLDEWDAGDDPGPIPPREWLLGNQFCRTFISSIVARWHR